ncbi:MAG: aminopeptidase P N-terminal domain-containing protein, partial [Bacteroidetes bacterium]|nr:aminopeptidase P N-terminal domain-containing protein [Bacteroidota bacterium]
MHKLLLAALLTTLAASCLAQADLPTDYLPASFHAGRRDSLRNRMPPHSVAVVFAYPTRNFSNDVDYIYHPNPDMYYFSGYRESDAVLLIFKDEQTAPDQSHYKDLFFIRRRDPSREQWTGRRLGVAGVQKQLGIAHVYEGAAFDRFPIDFAHMDKIIFDRLPDDLRNDASDSADLYDLVQSFRRKAAVPADFNPLVAELTDVFVQYAGRGYLDAAKRYILQRIGKDSAALSSSMIRQALACRDSADIQKLCDVLRVQRHNNFIYTNLVASLREIKTPEEMVLLRKSIDISCLAHAEAMKAVQPSMSELELQGIQEYVHKKLGAEYVGYPSIVGSGENGCVLHYEENTRTQVGTDMVLMDVGAEYHGYSADVTRTVPVSGKFSPEQKAIYNLVYEAQE